MIGKTIAQFEIVAKLGEGGMGVVYKARDTQLDRFVALKLLPQNRVADPERKRRFVQEAKAASALQHPSIAPIYEIGDSGGVSYIAMELVEGGTLAERLTRQPIGIAEILEIGAQAAGALDEAHGRGVVHRDIKPQNIMFTARGQVKVLDFGLAKVTVPESAVSEEADTVTVTSPGLVLGTVQYMSPEQALGRDVDGRSDLFSLGVVLYQATARRFPFRGQTTTEILHNVLQSQPEALSDGNPAAPPELERIVRKCLEKDKTRRYQTARDLAADLDKLRRDMEVGTSSRRNHPFAAVALALGIAGAAGFGLWKWSSSKPEATRIRSLAVLPFKSISQEENNLLGLGIADTLIAKVSQIGELTVRPTSAVRKFATGDVDVTKAAQELKVDAVLDGTVQRAGDQMRITVNLIRTTDGLSLWTETFDLKFTDIFDIQDRLSREAAARLQLKLSDTERARLQRRDTSNPAAYEFYLRGVQSFDRRGISPETRPQVETAIAMYRRALELDPSYALAMAQLAHAYAWMGLFTDPLHANQWTERAWKTIEEATALKSDLAELHVVRHELYFSANGKWRLDLSIRELKEAQRLNPSVGHPSLASLLSHEGMEEEALRAARRALEIDPNSDNARALAIEVPVLLGRADDSIRMHKSIYGDAPPPLRVLAQGHLALPQINRTDALKRSGDALKQEPRNARMRSQHALLLALEGRMTEAEKEIPIILADSENNRGYHHVTYDLACIAALQGKTKQAVEWLRRTADTGMPNYTLFSRDPNLNSIRETPDFKSFMTELKTRWDDLRRQL